MAWIRFNKPVLARYSQKSFVKIGWLDHFFSNLTCSDSIWPCDVLSWEKVMFSKSCEVYELYAKMVNWQLTWSQPAQPALEDRSLTFTSTRLKSAGWAKERTFQGVFFKMDLQTFWRRLWWLSKYKYTKSIKSELLLNLNWN